jgi:predicted amidohydrolase
MPEPAPTTPTTLPGFTVACAQFAPLKAELDHNLDKIGEIILQA